MPTELYGNIDYDRVAKSIAEIDRHTKRIRGVVVPDYERLPVAEKEKRESQIKKLASDCGCDAGARIAGIVTLLYLIATVSGLLALTSNPATNYVLTIPILLVAAVVGKLVGLKMIQHRLRVISNEIRADLLLLELGDSQKEDFSKSKMMC